MKHMLVDLPFLSQEVDRHSNRRIYVRRWGRRVRLKEKLGTPEFMAEYARALAELDKRAPVTPTTVRPAAKVGTLAWLGSLYFASTEFKALSSKSQQARRSILEECFREPHTDKDPEPMGNCPIVHFSSSKVKRLRDLKVGKPGAANNRRKWLSTMFAWAIENNRASLNPVRDVKSVRYATDGFHTWTNAEVLQFEAQHPIGTKGRLALALLLLTGTRRSDMVRLGRQHIKDGVLRFVPQKTRKHRAAMSEKPLLPELRAVIDASPCGDLTFLVTNYGKPFTANGFGNWFRERCDEAELPQCSAHGLRKAGATRAAENGATVNQLMALFDWESPRQAAVYTAKADRRKMAQTAMPLLSKRSE